MELTAEEKQKAQDTVMSLEQLQMRGGVKYAAQAQAEISFKAGMEVQLAKVLNRPDVCPNPDCKDGKIRKFEGSQLTPTFRREIEWLEDCPTCKGTSIRPDWEKLRQDIIDLIPTLARVEIADKIMDKITKSNAVGMGLLEGGVRIREKIAEELYVQAGGKLDWASRISNTETGEYYKKNADQLLPLLMGRG